MYAMDFNRVTLNCRSAWNAMRGRNGYKVFPIIVKKISRRTCARSCISLRAIRYCITRDRSETRETSLVTRKSRQKSIGNNRMSGDVAGNFGDSETLVPSLSPFPSRFYLGEATFADAGERQRSRVS